ncbi:hypothetical protein CYMTET_10697 [Cymbomonas tetramitiformis]|uniref:Uncharacterized protein n=1 Tax=Cymbomonas tetramitiformis TaxID=36881 RepID=A0AAE0GNQ7_9CHLO|nr:hypothetical protein CYMTET_10697 [Cymbomonas tetramitiformis]
MVAVSIDGFTDTWTNLVDYPETSDESDTSPGPRASWQPGFGEQRGRQASSTAASRADDKENLQSSFADMKVVFSPLQEGSPATPKPEEGHAEFGAGQESSISTPFYLSVSAAGSGGWSPMNLTGREATFCSPDLGDYTSVKRAARTSDSLDGGGSKGACVSPGNATPAVVFKSSCAVPLAGSVKTPAFGTLSSPETLQPIPAAAGTLGNATSSQEPNRANPSNAFQVHVHDSPVVGVQQHVAGGGDPQRAGHLASPLPGETPPPVDCSARKPPFVFGTPLIGTSESGKAEGGDRSREGPEGRQGMPLFGSPQPGPQAEPPQVNFDRTEGGNPTASCADWDGALKDPEPLICQSPKTAEEAAEKTKSSQRKRVVTRPRRGHQPSPTSSTKEAASSNRRDTTQRGKESEPPCSDHGGSQFRAAPAAAGKASSSNPKVVCDDVPEPLARRAAGLGTDGQQGDHQCGSNSRGAAQTGKESPGGLDADFNRLHISGESENGATGQSACGDDDNGAWVELDAIRKQGNQKFEQAQYHIHICHHPPYGTLLQAEQLPIPLFIQAEGSSRPAPCSD